MDERLRRSAAHVLVPDVTAPVVDDATQHHLLRVLRLRDGAAVTVTDGQGSWRPCTLDGGALVAADDVVRASPPQPALTVAVAPPKGDRLDWLVAKCTEVGVDRVVLLDAARSVVRWNGERAGRQVARLRRIVVEAAMQSRRVWLPEIAGPLPATAVLGEAAVAEPGGRRVAPGDTAIAVGPEGGWSPAELEAAGDTVSLGDTVLRVETAALVAAVMMVATR